jgi:hypothetical protein
VFSRNGIVTGAGDQPDQPAAAIARADAGSPAVGATNDVPNQGRQDAPACAQMYTSAQTTCDRNSVRAGEMQRIDRVETGRTRGNRLYARLCSHILTGRQHPGEALAATNITEQHGTSRTPMRPGGFRSARAIAMGCWTMHVARCILAIR